MRERRLLPLLGLLIAALSGSASGQEPVEAARVRLETNHGPILIELDRQAAPKSVANFLRYVREGFYDGTIFHRVIPGFVIQGGGFEPGMAPKPTHEPIHNEADNGLRNARGTLAMARTSGPHSATSQFFINLADNAALDHTGKTPRGWGYCVFGRVVEGMETVEAIAALPTTARGPYRDLPEDPAVIEAARVVTGR